MASKAVMLKMSVDPSGNISDVNGNLRVYVGALYSNGTNVMYAEPETILLLTDNQAQWNLAVAESILIYGQNNGFGDLVSGQVFTFGWS